MKYARSSRDYEGTPLQVIRTAQEGRYGGMYAFPSYAVALREIQHGGKRSCWMWYIWPSWDAVRSHSRPNMLLTSFAECIQYLQDPVLRGRLLEITIEATKHLKLGVNPVWLFGMSVDAIKFQQACTVFAVAALARNDEQAARVFARGLVYYHYGEDAGGRLNKRAVDVLREQNAAVMDTYLERVQAFVRQEMGQGDQILDHVDPEETATALLDEQSQGTDDSSASKNKQKRTGWKRWTGRNHRKLKKVDSSEESR